MEIVHAEINGYLESLYLLDRGEPVLDEMEALAKEKKFPIIGPLVGKACYLHALTMGAKRIYELGSGYGYSTFWFAKAVNPVGGTR